MMKTDYQNAFPTFEDGVIPMIPKYNIEYVDIEKLRNNEEFNKLVAFLLNFCKEKNVNITLEEAEIVIRNAFFYSVKENDSLGNSR